ALESFALLGEEPWEAMKAAIAAEHGHVVVAKGDLAERHRFWVEEPSPRADVAPAPETGPRTPVTVLSAGDDPTPAVRRIWSEVLGSDPDHDDADFFEAGGDSITAMRLRARIERQLGASLTLQAVLQNRTISGLAALVREWADQSVRAPANGDGSAE